MSLMLANSSRIAARSIANHSTSLYGPLSRLALDEGIYSWRTSSSDEFRSRHQSHMFSTHVASSSLSNTPTSMNGNNPETKKMEHISEEKMADHSWRQLNHIWTEEEIAERMATKDQKHIPITFADKLMSGVMKSLYWSFNTLTGYQHINPTAKSIEWRLIILESFAGVPGFLAAAFRHFYSLRTLKRDHGSIYTFLEEAENERMHLLVCLKMFKASRITKALVITAQISMTPFLMLTYAISPSAMHRFVGYLEETAVHTYSNIVEHCQTEGTHLHTEWAHLDAPDIAKRYWALDKDASWVTCLKHMLADEAHHRDVNHTFASLPEGSANPFVEEHMKNFDNAVVRRTEAILRNAMEQQGIRVGKQEHNKNAPLY